MSRAVHFLGLNQTTTLICAPDISLIQVSVSVSCNPGVNLRLTAYR
jgi:hypothetical protein